jgi:signal transduction histidine kinase
MSMLAILTIGSLFSLEVISLDPDLVDLSDSSVTWLTALVTFLMLSSVVVVATSLVQSCLQRSLEELNRKQSQMESYSERLEDMVAERTRALERAQEEVLRQEKLAAVGQLAGGVAHELRNPLGVISNAVYYLTSARGIDAETRQEYLGILDQETRNATKIISDLLSFSRGPVTEPERVFLGDFIPNAVSRQQVPEGIQVEVGVPLDLPPLYVDPGHLGQIVNNFFSNACDAMEDGGTIFLSAEKADQVRVPVEREKGYQAPKSGYLRLIVEDTGTGIEAEDLQQIFEPLFTTKSRGIGLGLAVTQNLVKANRGWIEVSSRIGEGTRIEVFLPAAEI